MIAFMLGGCGTDPDVVTPSPTGVKPDTAAYQSPAPSAHPSASPRVLGLPALTSRALRDAIDVESVRAHLDRLQEIADSHGGNRAAGTAGYDASVDYVASLLEAAGYMVEQQAFPLPGGGASVNLIAERPGTDGPEVVMLGAHLDSIPGGPGINDNGSGSMTLLALAERLAEFERPRRTVRFAFWGAEELGELGSNSYVNALDASERQRLTAYLNFDMLGSPNYIRFVYDDRAASPGSAAITRLFADYFEAAGLAWEPIDLSGKSDHRGFSAAGIPTGGLFSGGMEHKTDAQAAAFGGTSGVPADPCSHRACDTITNLNDAVIDEMADAIADVLVRLADGSEPFYRR
jgi:aminopeptidase S